MVGKVGIGPFSTDVVESMFAWKGENNTEITGYKVKIKNKCHEKVLKNHWVWSAIVTNEAGIKINHMEKTNRF